METVTMPKELTAENGAKYLFMGEFFIEIDVDNPNFGNSDDEPETLIRRVAVDWTTIKEIYAKAVEHLGS